MIRWIPYTFVRTVIFFIGGILLGFRKPDIIPEHLCYLLAGILTLLYFVVVIVGRPFRKFLNPGWIALSLVFLLGYIHLLSETKSRDANHLIHVREPVTYFRAVMTRFPEERERSWKMEARVTHINTGEWQEKQGRIMLYFSKKDFPQPFRYGDILLIKGAPQIPEGPANPGEFDYREYLALHNIYHQHFLRGGDVLKSGHEPPSRLIKFAFQSRVWAESTLERFVDGRREQSIASALVLGVTDGLDNELLNAYAATGSMHILAVSGLHVSIIYFVLLWMLSPLNKIPGGRWMVALIALMILWLYAFVTGLTPSVLRAVAMFSFLALARPWARSTNIYNTLAVSAFCLLLYDPFLIRSVGFQLSYLAVLGIVYMCPRILTLWEPQHRLTVEIWKVSAVAIAAQLSTFPLGLLYFHQFPNYFLLSNLLVVPLSFVVLILGLILLGASVVPVVASGLGFALEMVIRFLNAIVFTLEDFPFSMISNVYINPWQCALLFVFITFMLALFHYRKFTYAVFAFLAMLAYTSVQWYHFSKEVDIQKFTVYKIPGHSALDLIDRGQTFFLADAALQTDLQKTRFHISPNRLIAGVSSIHTNLVSATSLNGCKLISWNGKTILHVTGKDFVFPRLIAVDWLIIGNNAVSDPDKFKESVKFKKVILDSSNSFFFASRFLEAAKLHKLEVYSVLHQGAFISKIENPDS